MNREEFIRKLHPAITHIRASEEMKDETLHAINAMVEKVLKMDEKQLSLINKTNNPVMTKEQAIEAMQRGWKVTHGYFSPDEWVTMEGNI